MEAELSFLSEEDFLPFMEKENRAWRESCVKEGEIRAGDQTPLHYYYAEPPKARGAVVIFHGFCEFYGKYHELTYNLYRGGFSFFFLEQRGHGHSGGKQKEADIVYIDDYKTYVEDQHSFLKDVVLNKSGNLPLLLFAHSMGGAVASLFLEEYPAYFRAAVFSSPMLKLKTDGTPPAMIAAARLYMKLFRKQRALSPGQKRFSPEPVFESSSALSRARYFYQFNQRLKEKDYQTYGAAFGWTMASLDADKRLMKKADRITIPITLFTAGEDHLVDQKGYEEFCAKAANVRRIDFAHSRHEIFNARDEERREYFKLLLKAFEEATRD